VLENVMSTTQVGEVAELGGPALGCIVGVVEVASPERESTTGKAAMLIAHAEGAFEVFAGTVAVDSARCR